MEGLGHRGVGFPCACLGCLIYNYGFQAFLFILSLFYSGTIYTSKLVSFEGSTKLELIHEHCDISCFGIMGCYGNDWKDKWQLKIRGLILCDNDQFS